MKISLTGLKCLFNSYLPSEEKNYYAVISTTSLESEYFGSNRVFQIKSMTENHLHVGKGNEESRDGQKFMGENLPRSGCSVDRKIPSKEHLKDEWKSCWFELKTSDLGFLQLAGMSPSSCKKGRVRSMSQIPERNVCRHFPAPQARKWLLILAEGLNVLKTRKCKPLTSKCQLAITLPICLYHSNSATLETKHYNLL